MQPQRHLQLQCGEPTAVCLRFPECWKYDDNGGDDAFGFLPGYPYFWVLYLVTLCALGVVTAVYHDPESNRPATRRAAVAIIALAAVFAVLSSVLGADAVIVNPIAS